MGEFKKIFSQSNKTCPDCQEEHFIPYGKDRCIPCAYKKQKSEKNKSKTDRMFDEL